MKFFSHFRMFFVYINIVSGLFHRAILMSGSALSNWAVTVNPLHATMQVLTKLNCPLQDENEEMLKCLRKKNYEEILAARPLSSVVFGPVVDNLVIPNQPHKIMSQYNGMFSR